MKKVFITGFLLSGLITLALAQDRVHACEGSFLKRIENNLFQGQYNLAGKGDFEKRFFGDFNAQIEFFSDPSHDASGFRIVKKWTSYILEVKYVSNFNEIEKMFEDKLKSAWTSRNVDEVRKIRKEKEKSYRIVTRSFPLSNHFAEKLYEKTVAFINNFRATEVSDPDIVPIFRGDESITFRTVIKAELWSLWINHPGGDGLKMTNLYKEIITDVRAGKLDEKKYTSVLNSFNF